ncbi:MAG: hypothetical protein DRJ59_06140 [Thermoprotei archaeon]|nr:MAG: hypothetical protein DRJ59_06140 [Thermoprotei archaeon]
MSRSARLFLALILTLASTLSIALWIYLVIQPPETLLWGRPTTWWLAALSSLLSVGLLTTILLWIAYLLFTTPSPRPIEEELEEERISG